LISLVLNGIKESYVALVTHSNKIDEIPQSDKEKDKENNNRESRSTGGRKEKRDNGQKVEQGGTAIPDAKETTSGFDEMGANFNVCIK